MLLFAPKYISVPPYWSEAKGGRLASVGRGSARSQSTRQRGRAMALPAFNDQPIKISPFDFFEVFDFGASE